MSIAVLAEHCAREINHCRLGEPFDDRYCRGMLYRATVLQDQDARTWFQQSFDELVRTWLHHHPDRDTACRLGSEADYVAQAFERFWHMLARHQEVELCTLATALEYLHASLQGAVLDTLRNATRPEAVQLPASSNFDRLDTGNGADASEVWELLQRICTDSRERRVAYLLFHCGLKPREILALCPEEFGNVQEIYRLRYNILERLLHHPDSICWQRQTR